MIVMTREPDAEPDFTLQDFLSFDTPEGYRAELIDGEIVVTPPPDGNHERCIMRIVKQVLASSATPMDFSGQKGLIVPVAEGRQGRVIPDISFAPAKLDLLLDAPTWMPATGVAMVVEITSSSPDHDRNAKRRAYAAAQIPLYLLVDRQRHEVTLYGDSVRNEYTSSSTIRIGGGVKLPEPFSFTLETESFAV
jgi:Uma2 family endonuclease